MLFTIIPPPLLPALYTARLGSSHFTQHIRQSFSFTALAIAIWLSPSNLVDLGWAHPSAWHLLPLGVAWLMWCVLLALLVPAVTHRSNPDVLYVSTTYKKVGVPP